MQSLKVKVETVTPMFLNGADGKTPELRSPPFRGMMRYWLRATLGGVIGDRNLDGLHKLEDVVFGSPDTGSSIGVRLVPLSIKTQKAYILPHKNQGKRDGLVGSFNLVLTQPRDLKMAIWKAASASLNLALTFGGVGLRSRRGYGSLKVIGGDVKPFPGTINGWKSHIQQVVSSAIQSATNLANAYDVPVVGLPTRPASYPCATKAGLIRLCNIQASSARDAMIQFMHRVPQKNWLGGIHPRQASPLWVRPIRTGASVYGLLCAVLASRFSGANYEELKRFLDEFHGEYLQVKGWNI